MSDKPTIGIMGMGVVGKAAAAYYKGQGHEVLPYDKATDDKQALRRLNDKADVVLVCVGTPGVQNGIIEILTSGVLGMAPDCTREGELYCGMVRDAVASTAKPGRMIIIHSTLMPGTTDALQEEHPEARIVYVPEFLSEASAAYEYAHPPRPPIVGLACDKAWEEAEEPGWLKDLVPLGNYCGLTKMSATEAERLKLATNFYYALKVTVGNLLHDAGMGQDILWALGHDPRIGLAGFFLFHKGYRGFGGKCLPKDTRALAAYARQFERGKPLAEMIEKMLEYNAGLGVGR